MILSYFALTGNFEELFPTLKTPGPETRTTSPATRASDPFADGPRRRIIEAVTTSIGGFIG
jgi:hypothetical protein